MKYKIQPATIARTACLVLALVNQVLVSTGHSVLPIEDEQLTEAITIGATLVSSIVAWWYNNSFSQAALKADEEMKHGD